MDPKDNNTGGTQQPLESLRGLVTTDMKKSIKPKSFQRSDVQLDSIIIMIGWWTGVYTV